MIKVSHLKKSFGPVLAVDDLSFEIQKGEVVGFLGPNGAGKTTTMRILTGFLSCDEGEVRIDDQKINSNSARDLQFKIGYLPENNPLYKEMLVSEILDLSAALKKMSKEQKKKRLDFVVPAVGLKDVYYRPINELSKGYKQRVGMALALLNEPEILVMDEPTEGLDPNQRGEIRSLIKKMAKERTIILSTHVMQEASAVCNRLIVMNKGKLVADGTTEELSKLAHQDRILEVEIEGKEIEAELKKLSGVEKFQVIKRLNNKVIGEIFVEKKVELQPEISKLVSKHNWVIWKMNMKEYNLENIFHQLTN